MEHPAGSLRFFEAAESFGSMGRRRNRDALRACVRKLGFVTSISCHCVSRADSVVVQFTRFPQASWGFVYLSTALRSNKAGEREREREREIESGTEIDETREAVADGDIL
jgi:hypothetical protein